MSEETKNPKLVKVAPGVFTVRDYGPPKSNTASEVREIAKKLLQKIVLPGKLEHVED